MVEDLDANAVARRSRVGIGVLVRRLKQSPVQADLSLSEISALSRLDRGGSATTSELARVEQITPQAMGRRSPRLRGAAWWSVAPTLLTARG